MISSLVALGSSSRVEYRAVPSKSSTCEGQQKVTGRAGGQRGTQNSVFTWPHGSTGRVGAIPQTAEVRQGGGGSAASQRLGSALAAPVAAGSVHDNEERQSLPAVLLFLTGSTATSTSSMPCQGVHFIENKQQRRKPYYIGTHAALNRLQSHGCCCRGGVLPQNLVGWSLSLPYSLRWMIRSCSISAWVRGPSCLQPACRDAVKGVAAIEVFVPPRRKPFPGCFLACLTVCCSSLRRASSEPGLDRNLGHRMFNARFDEARKPQ